MATEGGPWADPPRRPEVPRGEVHVWRIALDRPEEAVDRLGRLLAPDERARAGRMLAGPVRSRFIVGRGMLRRVLGLYLRAEPARLAFRYGAQGKPALEPMTGAIPPEFNLSHTGGVALLAVASGRQVGVDVEASRPVPDLEALVARFFSARERAEFLATPAPERPAAFFRGWTRKEAFLKAIGTGLSMPLDAFDVPLGRDEPPRLLRVADRPDEAARWTLVDLDPGPGLHAALAAEGPGRAVRGYRADDPEQDC